MINCIWLLRHALLWLETWDVHTGFPWERAWPFLALALISAPLALLYFWRRAAPSAALAALAALPCLATFLVFWRPDAYWLVLTLDGVIFGLGLLDLWTLPSARRLTVERETQRVASIRQNQRVTLTITNRSWRGLRVWVRDDVPQEFEIKPKRFKLWLPTRSRVTVHYDFKASRRGAFRFEKTYLRVASWLGLWRRYVDCPVETVAHVYPDLKQLGEYAMLARTNRLSLMGLRRTRKIGQENEFERLRDYTADDNYKHLDWRASARRQKLTVRDFQANQSQRVIFLLDCGRMMTNDAGGLSLLDHALNAMLMMSYVALRQGDQVGLLCFSDEVHTYVPPTGGQGHMNQLLHASFDRFPKLVESRYDKAFLYLAANCRKRALVVLISNVIDEVNAWQLHQYLSKQVGRHLPLGVLLRDHRLFDAADKPEAPDFDICRAAVAADIIAWRQQVLTDLEHQGVFMLDVFPEEMTAPLVNQYLEIKARHLL